MPKYYVNVDGTGTFWYKDAKMSIRHREDGPAIERGTGHKQWWVNGVLHREGGPAIECSDGSREWFLNGLRHREDGPAVESSSGTRMWYRNGIYHREDGPAIELTNGDRAWYLNGEELTEKEFIRATQPAVELTVAEIERLLGKRVKIVK